MPRGPVVELSFMLYSPKKSALSRKRSSRVSIGCVTALVALHVNVMSLKAQSLCGDESAKKTPRERGVLRRRNSSSGEVGRLHRRRARHQDNGGHAVAVRVVRKHAGVGIGRSVAVDVARAGVHREHVLVRSIEVAVDGGAHGG